MIMGFTAQRPFYSVPACVGTWLQGHFISSQKTFRVWMKSFMIGDYNRRHDLVSTQRSFMPSVVSRTR